MSRPPPADTSQTTAPLSSLTVEPDAARRWWLHWVYPEARLTLLDRSEVCVGRDPTCDVVLADNKVSRRHATLRLTPGLPPQVQDLGSSNGTAVDGIRTASAWLHDGGVLRFGHSLAVLVHGENQAEVTCNRSADARWPYLGSEKLSRTLEQAERIARLPGALFISAETGTGKEYLARKVHAASGRPGPFVALNCAGVRGELAAAQLFGHVKGAFTGAHQAAPGALRQAHQGTVFLDEIAELPLESQALLLRAIQTREVTPVGGSTSMATDFRVVCASHAALLERVGKQAFRADLYYRLSAHQLALPPLRQRKEDVVAIFEHTSGIATTRLPWRLVEQLLVHDWPGNIRELENAALALRAQPGEPESWTRLPFGVEGSDSLPPEPLPPPTLGAAESTTPRPRELSARDWQELYTKYEGNAAQVARATGMKVSTVKRYFATFGVRGP